DYYCCSYADMYTYIF
nr:immunoglobulin light chain junction region [Macaca mulatta]